MLSDDPAVAAGRVEVELLSHEVAETRRVQVGARANDAVAGETAQLPGHVGQDVHWKGKGRENKLISYRSNSFLQCPFDAI